MERFWEQPATFRHFLEQQASEEQGFTLGHLGAFEQPVFYFLATPTDTPNNISQSWPEDTSLNSFSN